MYARNQASSLSLHQSVPVLQSSVEPRNTGGIIPARTGTKIRCVWSNWGLAMTSWHKLLNSSHVRINLVVIEAASCRCPIDEVDLSATHRIEWQQWKLAICTLHEAVMDYGKAGIPIASSLLPSISFLCSSLCFLTLCSGYSRNSSSASPPEHVTMQTYSHFCGFLHRKIPLLAR